MNTLAQILLPSHFSSFQNVPASCERSLRHGIPLLKVWLSSSALMSYFLSAVFLKNSALAQREVFKMDYPLFLKVSFLLGQLMKYTVRKEIIKYTVCAKRLFHFED